ncbi:MAG: diguanylate cyclase [Nitrospirota bacterium]
MHLKEENIRLLICDDSPADRSLVKQLLKMVRSSQYDISEADSGYAMMDILKRETFSVILLDISMPGKSGLEWLRELKNADSPPVIMATGQGDEMIAVEAMKNGAYDYLPKQQFSASSLSRTILNAIERWQLEKQVEKYRVELEHLANIDDLTGVMNRRSILRAAREKVAEAAGEGKNLGLIMFDIDYFKKLNDAYGHDAGDRALAEVARRLSGSLGSGIDFGRYGGEEFLAMGYYDNWEDAGAAAEASRAAVASMAIPVKEGSSVSVTVSIGLAMLSDGAKDSEELIKQADIALYKAKACGRNNVAAFKGEMVAA